MLDSRQGEGSCSQLTEVELGSGVSAAGKMVADGEGCEPSWGEAGCWEGVGGRELAITEAPAHHLPPTCAFQQPDGFASQGGSLESAAQGFPKQTRTLSQPTTPSSSDTHSLLRTKRFSTAVSLTGRISASARLFKVPFRFSAPRPCSYQAIAQARKD